mgnify:FL=1
MEHAISFPALGLDFNINRVAVNLFGKDIYWYGIIICLGFVLLTYRLLKQGDLPLALAVAMFTVYAVMEHCLSPGLNMTLYLMPIALYPHAEFALTLQPKAPPKEERSLT